MEQQQFNTMGTEPEEEMPEMQDPKAKKKNETLRDIADMLETVLVSVFVVVMLFAYVIRPVTVDGSSMEATLHNGDRLLMTDFFYTPKQGDIVIVNNDSSYTYDSEGDLQKGAGLSKDKRLIKRVIAVGGQTIGIDFNTGDVMVTARGSDEPYINNATIIDEGAFLLSGHSAGGVTISSWVTIARTPRTAVRSSWDLFPMMKFWERQCSGLLDDFGGIYKNYSKTESKRPGKQRVYGGRANAEHPVVSRAYDQDTAHDRCQFVAGGCRGGNPGCTNSAEQPQSGNGSHGWRKAPSAAAE